MTVGSDRYFQIRVLVISLLGLLGYPCVTRHSVISQATLTPQYRSSLNPGRYQAARE